MERVFRSVIAVFLCCSNVFAQATLTGITATPVRTGFVVITPLSGTGEGLIISETFGRLVGNSFFQASVPPNPLVTATALIVRAEPFPGQNTGVAIVNPNDFTATVTLTLRDQSGAIVATTSLLLSPRQHISRFVRELFTGVEVTGLLFVTSTLPVGVLGLRFRGEAFSSLPAVVQLGVNSLVGVTAIPTLTVNPTIGSTAAGTLSVTGQSLATSTSAIAGGPLSALPGQFPAALAPQFPVTGAGQVSTGILGQTAVTGQFPTSVGIQAPTSATFGTTAPLTTTQVVPTNLFVFGVQGTTTLGGPGSLLLPQFVFGGGWSTEIVIANTSALAQTVRVNFFNSAGELITPAFAISAPTAVTGVTIPPGGVIVFVTE